MKIEFGLKSLLVKVISLAIIFIWTIHTAELAQARGWGSRRSVNRGFYNRQSAPASRKTPTARPTTGRTANKPTRRTPVVGRTVVTQGGQKYTWKAGQGMNYKQGGKANSTEKAAAAKYGAVVTDTYKGEHSTYSLGTPKNAKGYVVVNTVYSKERDTTTATAIPNKPISQENQRTWHDNYVQQSPVQEGTQASREQAVQQAEQLRPQAAVLTTEVTRQATSPASSRSKVKADFEYSRESISFNGKRNEPDYSASEISLRSAEGVIALQRRSAGRTIEGLMPTQAETLIGAVSATAKITPIALRVRYAAKTPAPTAGNFKELAPSSTAIGLSPFINSKISSRPLMPLANIDSSSAVTFQNSERALRTTLFRSPSVSVEQVPQVKLVEGKMWHGFVPVKNLSNTDNPYEADLVIISTPHYGILVQDGVENSLQKGTIAKTARDIVIRQLTPQIDNTFNARIFQEGYPENQTIEAPLFPGTTIEGLDSIAKFKNMIQLSRQVNNAASGLKYLDSQNLREKFWVENKLLPALKASSDSSEKLFAYIGPGHLYGIENSHGPYVFKELSKKYKILSLVGEMDNRYFREMPGRLNETGISLDPLSVSAINEVFKNKLSTLFDPARSIDRPQLQSIVDYSQGVLAKRSRQYYDNLSTEKSKRLASFKKTMRSMNGIE